MIIDETYFGHEPLLISGLEVQGNGYSGDITSDRINGVLRAIKRFEPLFMKALLGKDAYAEFLLSETDAKWNALKAVLRDTDYKISPIANYVFYHYHLENSVKRGDTGDYVPKADNMQSVSAANKLSLVWNDMVNQNEVLCQWLYDNVMTADTPLAVFTDDLDIDGWSTEQLLEYKSILTFFV